MENYADLMFHEAVAELQKQEGTYEKYKTFYPHRRQDQLSENDIAFLQDRESIYIASTTPDGWPYIQHRGGPRGFLKVMGENRIACADYRGNQQFITMGNLKGDDRVSVFCMDYMNRARLKIQGRATLVSREDADADLLALVDSAELPAERVLVIDIVAMDWNCPQYIPQLLPAEVVQGVVAQKLGALQAENEALKAELETNPKLS